MTDKKLELINKIRNLSKEGYLGEKNNAQKMLEKLMKKHGIIERR